jgi:hypothetical protein
LSHSLGRYRLFGCNTRFPGSAFGEKKLAKFDRQVSDELEQKNEALSRRISAIGRIVCNVTPRIQISPIKADWIIGSELTGIRHVISSTHQNYCQLRS